MSLTSEERSKFFPSLFYKSKKYWDDLKDQNEKLSDIYTTDYFERTFNDQDINNVQVELPIGYNIVKSYRTAVFSKNPGMTIKNDSLLGSPELKSDAVEVIVNRWIKKAREPIENATTMATIYPSAFIRFYVPNQTTIKDAEPRTWLDAPALEAIPPWEVIVDFEANSWENQRFVGSWMEIQIGEVKRRFNKKASDSKFSGRKKEFYMEKDINPSNSSASIPQTTDEFVPKSHQYIRVTEIYDLINGTYTVFTTDHQDGYYEFLHVEWNVKDVDDKILVPIFPYYIEQVPDKPLIGMSTLKRQYPLISELNQLRTHQANLAREDSSIVFLNKAFQTDQTTEAIKTGAGNKLISTQVPEGMSLSEIAYPLVKGSLMLDLDRYENLIQSDLQKSSLFAPFTRGEMTKSTATEVAISAQYSSSEESHLQRIKNAVLESIAKYYVRWLALQFTDYEETVREINPLTIPSQSGEAILIDSKLFSGKFEYFATDEADTPLTKPLRDQQFLQLLPYLTQLGANPAAMLEEIVNRFNLPDKLKDIQAPKETQSDINLEPTAQQELPEKIEGKI